MELWKADGNKPVIFANFGVREIIVLLSHVW